MYGIAFAMGAGGAPPGGEGGPAAGIASFIPLILIFGIFYFLLIRPQQKRAREHQQFLDGLKKGDQVITSGGLHGMITGLTDKVVTLEIADKVRVKVSRAHVQGSVEALKEGKEESCATPSAGGG
ncbi:MAG: preprotein translocase subunit YajC [Thermodesulfobacteriota bacterium]